MLDRGYADFREFTFHTLECISPASTPPVQCRNYSFAGDECRILVELMDPRFPYPPRGSFFFAPARGALLSRKPSEKPSEGRTSRAREPARLTVAQEMRSHPAWCREESRWQGRHTAHGAERAEY